MGTRSTTHVFETDEPGAVTPQMLKNAKHVVSIYRQFDGYPEGHGKDLAAFASKFTIVNGFGGGMKMGTHANGGGCFGAQLIRRFKRELGNIYITTQDDRQAYDYFLYVRAGEWGFGSKPATESFVHLIVKRDADVIFDGPVKEYKAWLKEYMLQEAGG
jgi:hypothetical protein